MAVSHKGLGPIRIAVVGGGPAGSFFALHALKFAGEAGREVSVTIYEGRDFRRSGPTGCNMCAGIIPVSYLNQFTALGLVIPPAMILSRIRSYSLHTSACTLSAVQPDAEAEIVSVYRGTGPWSGSALEMVSFDEWLIQEAVSRGAVLRRSFVEAVHLGPPAEVTSAGEGRRYDLVVLASGVNGRQPVIRGLSYGPPPTGSMCQTELHLGREETDSRLGSSVHIFLPPEEIASYGILIPKSPFVTVSLLNPRHQMSSLRRFLELDDVKAVLGDQVRRVCGCMPRTSVGIASHFSANGFVAIGDAAASRLYKNGIGSALATAARAACTAVYRGFAARDFEESYLPLCRAIHHDNRIGRLLFMQVPMLKHMGIVPRAHCHVASSGDRHQQARDLHARVLWGMFTGAYSYGDLLRLAVSPNLLLRMALALAQAALHGNTSPRADGSSLR